MLQKKYNAIPIIALFVVVLIKLLFLLTHHIQEDAFITWRVAQNLVDYGVIGFNGNTKISASTTHLYVFVSYLFNLIFGKEYFIYPLLIFNSLAFTFGSYLLSKILLNNVWQQFIFILLFGLLPPAIKISILGMEYGILFLLEISLLYFGFYKHKKIALLLLPTLIMFTRIDTIIFLGIIFLVDLIFNKKIKWAYILGGVIGLVVCLAFNWFYFGEWVNNTIIAKKITYDQVFTTEQNIRYFLFNFGNFWGMLKLPGTINPITIVLLIFEIIAFALLMKLKDRRNMALCSLFVFGWIKQIIFLSQKSYFDWYYWVPQLLLFIPIILLIVEQKKKKTLWMTLFILFYLLPLIAFQTVHSIATGNGEWNYRRSIGLFLNTYEKDKKQWILLEPAGYVPYYSQLKTIDEVGLVDKQIQAEILKDKPNYWLNTVKKRQPKYLLSYNDLYQSKSAAFYKSHYKLIKKFRIKDFLKSDNPILDKIYLLKPSGTDYNLYEKK